VIPVNELRCIRVVGMTARLSWTIERGFGGIWRWFTLVLKTFPLE